MFVRKSILAAALAIVTVASAMPVTAAEARGRHWKQDRHERSYYNDRGRRDYRCQKSGGTTGLLLGGVAGALLGRSVDTRGDRAPGTIIGAGAGALAGRAIDRGSSC